MTGGSSMAATILVLPPHSGQVSTSMPKTRLSSRAQLIRAGESDRRPAALQTALGGPMGRFLRDWSELPSLSLDRKVKTVFTNGCFDLLHVGHVRYLQQARALGDRLVVGLNSDASVRRLKGPDRPLQSEGDRAEILAALAAVDFTVIFEQDTPMDLIRAVRPAVLAKGGDWKPEDIVGGPFVLSYGGAVRSLQFVDGRSTTAIVNKMSGDSVD